MTVDYYAAVSWAAQTALRDIIGRTELTDLLRGRERIETELQQLIDQRSKPWGVTVGSVEMRDVVIPVALQDAMSREAQAAREKQAPIILGEPCSQTVWLTKNVAERVFRGGSSGATSFRCDDDGSRSETPSRRTNGWRGGLHDDRASQRSAESLALHQRKQPASAFRRTRVRSLG